MGKSEKITEGYKHVLRQYFAVDDNPSQAEIARLAGLSGGTISQLLSGESRGSKQSLSGIAAAMGLDYKAMRAGEAKPAAVGAIPVDRSALCLDERLITLYPDIAKHVRLLNAAVEIDRRLCPDIVLRISEYMREMDQAAAPLEPYCQADITALG